jgi:hypothetical protein
MPCFVFDTRIDTLWSGVVAADELPNVPHLGLATMGNFAKAKVKEALLAFTGW